MQTNISNIVKLISENIVNELTAYHGGPEGIEHFLLDGVKVNNRLMGTGIYVTTNTAEAEEYSKGMIYTVDIPEDNGSNYLLFTDEVPEDVLENVAKGLSAILSPEETIMNGRKSLVYLLCAVRQSFLKSHPGEREYGYDRLLNNELIKNGYVGHKMGNTYVIYDPENAKIVGKKKFIKK